MPSFTSTILFSLAAVLSFFTISGNHGLLHLSKINNELAALENKNRKLESDIGELQRKIFLIEHDSFTLEKVAREELGLAKPGERVYLAEPRNNSR